MTTTLMTAQQDAPPTGCGSPPHTMTLDGANRLFHQHRSCSSARCPTRQAAMEVLALAAQFQLEHDRWRLR
jgi:hypothetical protein